MDVGRTSDVTRTNEKAEPMICSFRHNFSLALVGALALPFLGERNRADAADVNVNFTAQKQVIDGFGASSAWCGTISDKVMNSLYGDLGYSILRVRIEELIGDNNWKNGPYNSWSAELANAKKASAKGAIVFASPWNPPPALRNTGGGGAFSIKPETFAGYRDYLNAYVKYFKDNGVNLHAISIQNEPDYSKDWTYWSPTQIRDFIKNYGASITTKLMSGESFSYLKNLFDPTLNDPAALENVDIFGTHIYGTSFNNFTYPLFEQKGRPLGKRMWMTEHFLNEDDDMTKTVMPVAREIHECLVTGSMNAYVYWWITWANGLAKSDGTIFKRAYVIGHFAKHIRPGYFRVEATAVPATNVFVSAYTGSGKAVIVVVNTGTGTVNQKFNLQGGNVGKLATFQTTSSKNMAAGSEVAVSGNSFTTSLPGQSITTFVGDIIGSSVRQTPSDLDGFRTIPGKNGITVTPSSSDKSFSVAVRSMDGRIVASSKSNKGATSIKIDRKGSYLIEIESDGRSSRELVPVF
jgi:glucuronoarabinoxylan endo-1,4-beta-xylanase